MCRAYEKSKNLSSNNVRDVKTKLEIYCKCVTGTRRRGTMGIKICMENSRVSYKNLEQV